MDAEQAVVYQGIETVHTGRCCLMPLTPHFCPKHHQPLRLRISPGLRTNENFARVNDKSHLQPQGTRSYTPHYVPDSRGAHHPSCHCVHAATTFCNFNQKRLIRGARTTSSVVQDSRGLQISQNDCVQSCSIHISACSFEQCKSM